MHKFTTYGVLTAGLLLAASSSLSAQARCDFDGDGLSELAFGVPGDADGVGAIYVIDYKGDLTNYSVEWFRPGQNVDSFGAVPGTHFGAALACGDFNGDGDDDLAVGAPGSTNNQGFVAVLYGSPTGLEDPFWDGRLYQGLPELNETMEDDDFFGAALTAGDFNDDGTDDLAIGVPGEVDPGGLGYGGERGLVHVLYGRSELTASADFPPGLTPLQSEKYHIDLPEIDILGDAAYGRSLVAADFDGDGVDDLATGAPHAWVDMSEIPGIPEMEPQAGVAQIMLGVAGPIGIGGIDVTTSLTLSQAIADNGAAQDELFGYALAAGNFDASGGAELAVGVVRESIRPGAIAAGVSYGAVNVFEIAFGGAAVLATEFWSDDFIIGNGNAPGENWGFSLTTGDFDGSGEDDLVIGRPGDRYPLNGPIDFTGAVTILYGSPFGLPSGDSDQRFIETFTPGAEGQEFGFAVTSGSFLDPNEVNLVVGAPGWKGMNDDGEILNAGAVTVFRGIAGVGVADGSPDGLLHKDMIEKSPTWPAENNMDKMVLPADTLLEGDWLGERFGAALAR